MQTYYPSAYNPRLAQITCVEGSALTLGTDFKGMVGELGVDLDLATWVAEGPVTLTGEPSDSVLSTVLMTADRPGKALVECLALFVDGQIRKQQYEISISPSVQ